MNHVYRIVWSQAKSCWQAVCETASTRSKNTSSRTVHNKVHGSGQELLRQRLKPSYAAVLCGLGLLAGTVSAGPTGGQVSAGTASITQSGATTTIQQASQKAAIDWTSFSVGNSESVRFNQPNASAITLNRVTGTERSEILGNLSANGQVFILNPNGVLFGKGAQVNVGGLVASTLRMSNEDFMAGNYKFTEGVNGSAAVVNEGRIQVAEGGVLALIAPVVTNTGTLIAPQGSVLMAGADAVTVTLQDGSLVSYTIDKGNLQALVDNGGLIQAEGGHVVLTAKGLDALSRAVVNHSGVIEAQTVSTKNGIVELLGDMEVGLINMSGKIDASAPNGGDGGFVETNAAKVKVADSAQIDTRSATGKTGEWLIDPDGYTIASGANGDIAGATLTAILSASNASIVSTQGKSTDGNINVNESVSWSANRLSLVATKDIYINADLNGSGTARLALEYGQGAVALGNTADYHLNNGAKITLPAGQNFSTKLGSDGVAAAYTVITSLGVEGDTGTTTLQGMKNNPSGNYALGADIDASRTSSWNGGAGWEPIGGEVNTPFSGSFQGFGHVVSGLSIERTGTANTSAIGMFGFSTGLVRSVGLQGVSVIANPPTSMDVVLSVGGLVGALGGTVVDSYTSGPVISNWGASSVGGVVGVGSRTSSILNSYSSVTVSGGLHSGGLAGSSAGVISDSRSSGAVVGYFDAGGAGGSGGLVGYAGEPYGSAVVSNSYSTSTVIGGWNGHAGGLVGRASFTTIQNSYSTGSVTDPTASIGGLVGFLEASFVVNSYSTGAVAGGGWGYAGGLVGRVQGGGAIQNSYSTGRVAIAANTDPANPGVLGGLVGANFSGSVINSYWNTETSNQTTSSGGVGLSTAQMKQQTSFAGWDFSNTWRIVEGSSYPMLRALTQGKLTLTAAARDASKVYDKTAWFGGTVIDYSGFTGSDTPDSLSGSIQWGGTSQGAVDVGTYTLIPGGVFSQKYEIDYKPGTLYIAPRILNLAVTKTYDGTGTFKTGFNVTNLIQGDTVNITGEATVPGKDIGTYNAFTSNTLDAGNKNYTLNPVNTPQHTYGSLGSVAATIDPATISLLGISGGRIYDGTTYANWNDLTTLQGLRGGDEGKVYLVSGKGTLDGRDTGLHRLLSIDTLRLGGPASNNYIIDANGSYWTIYPRPIDVAVNKVFDGTSSFSSGFSVGNIIDGDTVNVLGNANVESSNSANYYSFTASNLTVDNKNYVFSTGSKVSAAIQRAPITIWVSDQKITEGDAVTAYSYKLVRSDNGELLGPEVVTDVVYSSSAENKYKMQGYGTYPIGLDMYYLNSKNYFVKNVYDGTLLVTPKFMEYFFGAKLESVRGALNGNIPKYDEATAYGSPWILLPPSESILHNDGIGLPERKYVHPDGREVVFDGNTHQIVRGGVYGGTFNFVNNSDSTAGHVLADMAPSWQLREICFGGNGGGGKCAGSIVGNETVARAKAIYIEDVVPQHTTIDSGEIAEKIEGDRMQRYASISEINIFTAYYAQAIGTVNEGLKSLYDELFKSQSSWLETLYETENHISNIGERVSSIDLSDPSSLIELTDEIASVNSEMDRDINKINEFSTAIDSLFDAGNIFLLGRDLFEAAGLAQDAVDVLSDAISKHKGNITELDKSMVESLNQIVEIFPGIFDDGVREQSLEIMHNRNIDDSLAKIIVDLVKNLSMQNVQDASHAAGAVYSAFEMLLGAMKGKADKDLYVKFLKTADKKDVHKIITQNYLLGKLGFEKIASQNTYSIKSFRKILPWDNPIMLIKVDPKGVAL